MSIRTWTQKQVEEYVERELREALPQGWSWRRPDAGRLWWNIKRVSIPDGEWPDQEYDLHVSEDLAWFILTYDNNDIGVGGLWQEFQKARVISASTLERYPLHACVQYALEHCLPNQWGYT